MIGPFKGEHRWLSNFWEAPILVTGQMYRTTEHFYQASKASNMIQAFEVLAAPTPGKAKRLGAKIEVRSDWDQIKVSVMTLATFSKFTQNPKLAEKLISTGDEAIVEINEWCDNFWGVCVCGNPCGWAEPGENRLGRILMDVKSYLQKLEEYSLH